jgi:hypothetical protein
MSYETLLSHPVEEPSEISCCQLALQTCFSEIVGTVEDYVDAIHSGRLFEQVSTMKALSLTCRAVRRLCLPYLLSSISVNKTTLTFSEQVRSVFRGPSSLSGIVR